MQKALKKLNQVNSPIYHYTSLDAMMNILDTKSLWATNCQYLNDILETKYIIKIFEDIAKELSGDNIELTNIITNMFDSKVHQDLINKIFIISFSKEKDSVSMWRNYGRNGVVNEELRRI